MNESGGLVGRQAEIQQVRTAIEDAGCRLLIVYGQSGIGKTKLLEQVRDLVGLGRAVGESQFHTIYRTDWRTALAQMKRRLVGVPANATRDEIEAAMLDWAAAAPRLLVLDNVDEGNLSEVEAFGSRWIAAEHNSTLILTCQNEVRAVLPAAWPDLEIRGLTDEADILLLLGTLSGRFPIDELRRVSQRLGGNPQLLLFLQWLEPDSIATLHESAAKLVERHTSEAIEDLIDQTSLSTLFFLALGVHKDLNVGEEMLAALWDHFGSRGAEPFVRSIRTLTERGFLTPTTPGSFRLHESVHVTLPKVLVSRVGEDRIPSLHHYFAEYYRRRLSLSPSSTSLGHFAFHARAAQDFRLAFETLVEAGVAEALASRGSTLQVRAELETLESSLQAALSPLEMAQYYVTVGRLCNDLSDHAEALRIMSRCLAQLEDVEPSDDLARLQRDIWYINAVAHSNTGQSTQCLQNYYRIVASSADEDDDRACVALGYLAHDLKYRDLATARVLGELAVQWARSFNSGLTLAKNLCSLAETLALEGAHGAAGPMFLEAEGLARGHGSDREMGRILTNSGFAEMLSGQGDGLHRIRAGYALSRSLGDRRRHAQGLVYEGVCLIRAGSRVDGRANLVRAAESLRALGDGRYFTPALCWLLQVGGYEPRLYNEEVLTGRREDLRELADHARAHPEFAVYESFWTQYLSNCIGTGTPSNDF